MPTLAELRLITARDELQVATAAVPTAEQGAAEAEAELASLDGALSTAWGRLTGSRESDVTAAAARVLTRRRRVEVARAAVLRAEAAVVAAEAAVAEEQGAVVRTASERVARLRARVARGGAEAREIEALELERALLAERVAQLEAASTPGSHVVAVYQTSARSVETDDRNLFPRTTPARVVAQAFASAGESFGRFQLAMRALGREDQVRYALDGEDDHHRTARFRELVVALDRERREIGGRVSEIDARLAELAAS